MTILGKGVKGARFPVQEGQVVDGVGHEVVRLVRASITTEAPVVIALTQFMQQAALAVWLIKGPDLREPHRYNSIPLNNLSHTSSLHLPTNYRRSHRLYTPLESRCPAESYLMSMSMLMLPPVYERTHSTNITCLSQDWFPLFIHRYRHRVKRQSMSKLTTNGIPPSIARHPQLHSY